MPEDASNRKSQDFVMQDMKPTDLLRHWSPISQTGMNSFGDIPINIMDDREKQTYPSKTTMFTQPSKMTKAELRRVILLGSIVGVITMTLFTTILFLGMLFFSKVMQYPEIFIVGRAVGNVTADLGAMGKMEVFPEFHLESRLHLS